MNYSEQEVNDLCYELHRVQDEVRALEKALHEAKLKHERARKRLANADPDVTTDHVLPWGDCPNWHATHVDAEVERAYRRGFGQGVAQAVYALQKGATLKEVDNWLWKKVWSWRYRISGNSFFARAVEPPRHPRDKPEQKRPQATFLPVGFLANHTSDGQVELICTAGDIHQPAGTFPTMTEALRCAWASVAPAAPSAH